MQFIDETEADLRGLIERDFGPVGGGFSNRLVIDWIHYRARLIPCRPRRVLMSAQVLAQRNAYPAIDRIRIELEMGRDVSPWLSDRVRKRKDDPLADLMFNDWQISHFHLGNLFMSSKKVGPRPKGELLLFAHVKADRATFIDLHPHGAWTRLEILRVLHQTSPNDLPEMKGIRSGTNPGPTDEEALKLRLNGYTAPVHFDSKVFLSPGLGINSSQHATRLEICVMCFNRALKELREAIEKNTLPWSLQSKLVGMMGLPVRLGVKLVAGSLVIYEKSRGINFTTLRALE